MLDSQINFRPDINRVEFKRSFKENFKNLNTLKKESISSTIRIRTKLSEYPNILKELDYRLALDASNGKLSFMTQYMEKNNIDLKSNHIKEGFLPLLITVNLNSKSSPIRPVLVPNINAILISNLNTRDATA